MSELEGRVGEGCLGVISKEIDEKDPKNIGDGIKTVASVVYRIEEAEKRRREEEQKVTIQEKIDSVELANELKRDMGEETMLKEEDEESKSDFER